LYILTETERPSSWVYLSLVKIFQGPYLKIPIFLTSLRRSNWKDRIRHWHWKWGQKWDGQKSKLKHQQHNIIRSKSKSGIGLSLVTSFGIALVSMLENVVNAISRWQFVDANTGSPRYSRTRLFTFTKLVKNDNFLVKNGLFICEFRIRGPNWWNVSTANNEGNLYPKRLIH